MRGFLKNNFSTVGNTDPILIHKGVKVLDIFCKFYTFVLKRCDTHV